MKKLIPQNTSVIPSLLKTLGGKGTERFKAAKQLQLISESDPALLYPHFEIFAELLDSNSSVLLWNTTIILSHLARVDVNRHFDIIFDKYYQHLWDGKLVTAANILGSSGHIARYRRDLAGRITHELLKVEVIPLPTSECREVARGHVLSSLAEYPDFWNTDPAVHNFIIRCSTSHRPAVRKRAEELLNKFVNSRRSIP